MSKYGVVGCIAILIYMGILLVIAFRASRNKANTSTGKTFYLGRGIGALVLLFSTMASSFSTWVIMGCPVTTYSTGFSWIILVTLYQMTFAITCGYLGPRYWRLRKARDYVTQSDLVVDYFKDSKIRYLMGTAFILGMVSSCVAQFRAMGTTINTMSDGYIPFWAATLILLIVITVYACVGGFTGSAMIDTFQGMLFTLVLWGGLIVVIFKIGGFSHIFTEVAAVDPKYILFGDYSADSLWTPTESLTFCLACIMGSIVAPGYWQRYYAADNPQSLKKMSVWFPLLVGLGVSTTGGLVGLSAHAFQARGYEISNASSVFQLLLSGISTPWWSVLVVIAVLAAGMSTVAGYTSGSSLIVTYDFIRNAKPDANDVKLRDYGRYVIIVLMCIGWVLAQYSTAAVTALIALASSFYACALYPIFTIFIWKRGTYAGCLAGQICSLVGVIVTNFIIKSPFDIHPGVWGLICGFAAYFIVSAFTKPVPEEWRKTFFEPLERTKVFKHTKCE